MSNSFYNLFDDDIETLGTNNRHCYICDNCFGYFTLEEICTECNRCKDCCQCHKVKEEKEDI